jgi:hypothetical protein
VREAVDSEATDRCAVFVAEENGDVVGFVTRRRESTSLAISTLTSVNSWSIGESRAVESLEC